MQINNSDSDSDSIHLSNLVSIADMRFGRRIPKLHIFVAGFVGVFGGIYIWKPIIEESIAEQALKKQKLSNDIAAVERESAEK